MLNIEKRISFKPGGKRLRAYAQTISRWLPASGAPWGSARCWKIAKNWKFLLAAQPQA
ncbi:hypothetical protein [Paraburkholderia domus]|uniref:hypothetical protein n=1 Tax=Paraburkholderia domus TaxID=2793075 RepID=UPI0019121368|nr:hypothetical protein [Paraburkholderia domus]MBK5049986.1 hypothetical protein [Burkholderia sp. R-70006]MBK5063022.1 hypothetical protein [Burkholderia sp. R-70199]MBK5166587.1 hypothetical protein [Burkholderia sp. R-70211]MCI0147271.1 hypothetical protein [Paraburkholderia sediminicola]